jgi:NTE family protein
MPQPSPAFSGTALALQGGGAHGAFAWGVADRLLEEGAPIAALCGVSSGALLAVMVAQGMVRGGPAGARQEMRRLWTRIGQAQTLLPWLSGWELWGAELFWQSMEPAMRMFSPAQFNPFGINPLRDLLRDLLDRKLLNHPDALPVTVSATDVETGEAVLFDNAAIDVDILLASCCLPFVFPAVEIGGRGYWDGAYSGNPPLRPLLAAAPPPAEIILIGAQPRRRPGIPRNASEIFHRLNELASLATLQSEIAALPAGMRLLSYDADIPLLDLPAFTKIQASDYLFGRLFQAGRGATPKLLHGGGPG